MDGKVKLKIHYYCHNNVASRYLCRGALSYSRQVHQSEFRSWTSVPLQKGCAYTFGQSQTFGSTMILIKDPILNSDVTCVIYAVIWRSQRRSRSLNVILRPYWCRKLDILLEILYSRYTTVVVNRQNTNFICTCELVCFISRLPTMTLKSLLSVALRKQL